MFTLSLPTFQKDDSTEGTNVKAKNTANRSMYHSFYLGSHFYFMFFLKTTSRKLNGNTHFKIRSTASSPALRQN